MTRNAWIIFVVICAALIGGLIWTSQSSKTDVDDVNMNVVQPASETNGNIADHTVGNPDAKVVVVEYADYNCPGCKVADPAIKTAVENYKDDVLLIIRNFPLAQLHPNARAAAAAAEAAGLQDKFFEMHEKLYLNSTDWQSLSIEKRTQYFDRYASEIGLDIDKFSSDMNSDRVEAKISLDIALGQKAAVSGTPSIHINGVLINKHVKDGKLVPESDKGSQPIWASADTFEEFGLLPALKEAGITVKQ